MRILIVTESLYIARSMVRDCSQEFASAEVKSVIDLPQLAEMCADFRPEIIAFDGDLLLKIGERLIQEMRANTGDSVKILGFAFCCNHVTAWLVRKTELAGYLLLEDVGPFELTRAIVRIRNGKRVFSPEILKLIKTQQSWKNNAFRQLSETQQLLLGLFGCGLGNAEIAQLLGLKVQSVKNQKTRIANLFNIKTTAKLVRFALEMGFATYALGGNPMRAKHRLLHSKRMVAAVQTYMNAKSLAGIRRIYSSRSHSFKKCETSGGVCYRGSPVTLKLDPLDKTVVDEVNELAFAKSDT